MTTKRNLALPYCPRYRLVQTQHQHQPFWNRTSRTARSWNRLLHGSDVRKHQFPAHVCVRVRTLAYTLQQHRKLTPHKASTSEQASMQTLRTEHLLQQLGKLYKKQGKRGEQGCNESPTYPDARYRVKVATGCDAVLSSKSRRAVGPSPVFASIQLRRPLSPWCGCFEAANAQSNLNVSRYHLRESKRPTII